MPFVLIQVQTNLVKSSQERSNGLMTQPVQDLVTILGYIWLAPVQ